MAQIIEWSQRHGIDGSDTDLRCAYEDAASALTSENAALKKCEKELREAREVVMQFYEDATTLRDDLNALRSLVAKKDEALRNLASRAEQVRDMLRQIVELANVNETTRAMLRMGGNDLNIQAMIAKQALALTDAQLEGMALVEAKELAELRRDRERLDWLGNYYWDKFVVRFTSCADEKQLRAAIDAAMKP